MKLYQIYVEQKGLLKALYKPQRLRKLQKSLAFMPSAKQKHSIRVGSMAAKTGLDRDHVDAAILHDYIERGGNPSKLSKLNISEKALQIIRLLSVEEKAPGADDTATVNDHIRTVLDDPNIDEHTKDVAIVIKASDRLDNLRRRLRAGKLKKDYWRASVELLEMLFSRYHGDSNNLRYLRRKFNKVQNTVAAHGTDVKIAGYK